MTRDYVWECTGNGQCGADVQGHGTHCAGTAGGKTYGTAPEALVYAIKTLSDRGSGARSWQISGIDCTMRAMTLNISTALTIASALPDIVSGHIHRRTGARSEVAVRTSDASVLNVDMHALSSLGSLWHSDAPQTPRRHCRINVERFNFWNHVVHGVRLQDLDVASVLRHQLFHLLPAVNLREGRT